MPPIKAVLQKVPELSEDGATVVVCLDVVHLGTNAPIKPNVRLNLDLVTIQQKIDDAADEVPSRLLTDAQAVEELIAEWLSAEQDRMNASPGPPDWANLGQGLEVLPGSSEGPP